MDFLQEESFRIARDSDFFFQEAILDFVACRGRPFAYFKKDYLFKDGRWRGTYVDPVGPSDFRGVVIIGHSDYEMTTNDVLRLGAVAWPRAVFASNLMVSPVLHHILGVEYLPLGLSNPTNESEKHEIFGDWSLVRDVVLEKAPTHRPDRARVYANFDPLTAPEHRQKVAAVCEGLDHIEVGQMQVSKSGRIAYLRAMRDAGLVVCPRGNGPDTHRFYEALYVGAVPVVLTSSYAAKIASRLGLPHLAIQDWSELNDLASLRLRAASLRAQPCSLQWIRKSAWLERLESIVT